MPSPEARILVVDDEEGFRAFFRYVLEPLGYRVLTASSGPEALDAVRDCPPDLVLLDGYLGRMSGLDTLRELKTLEPSLPVLMLSVMDAALKADAMAAGALDCVQKPSDPTRIEELVRRGLGGPP